MHILLVEPQKRPRLHDIPGDLTSMQALVGGAIQAVYPFDEPVALVCHEEGKLLGLPQNRALRHPGTGEIYDIICGTFFLCAARRCDRKGDFENLFSGLAFCADCGKAMSTVGTRKKGSAANLACGAYKLRGSAACSNHFISYEALYACVLEAVRSYVSLSEEECDALFERLNRRLRLDEREHETARERERLRTELDRVQRLVAQLYEDRLAGKIGETNFYPLLERYEQKTAELQRQIGAMETGDSADDLRAQQERLRAVIRRYQDIDELTPSLLFELIERIEVGQGTYEKTAEGKVKRQRISIQFRFLPEPCEFDWTE